MSLLIELPAQELADLRSVTKHDNDSDAVIHAAREYLRMSRLRELKAASGKVDFDLNWQKLEEKELGEIGLPQ